MWELLDMALPETVLGPFFLLLKKTKSSSYWKRWFFRRISLFKILTTWKNCLIFSRRCLLILRTFLRKKWYICVNRQCQCLPICFITFDLTNQKQELKNFDCKTSWLVYICELILARAKPYRNVLKLSFINDKSWWDGCANLCPWSLGKRRNSTSVYSIPVELNFNHRRGGYQYFF